jgi:hypothetical protein
MLHLRNSELGYIGAADAVPLPWSNEAAAASSMHFIYLQTVYVCV